MQDEQDRIRAAPAANEDELFDTTDRDLLEARDTPRQENAPIVQDGIGGARAHEPQRDAQTRSCDERRGGREADDLPQQAEPTHDPSQAVADILLPKPALSGHPAGSEVVIRPAGNLQ
ncbi:MAG: hypothetical protein JRH01_10350 [Deltaproteobacteria bacterium]|nr:hypothetical protein [Deltaproteobacteria bacterium]MBW2392730.1 hypothetical protein [Deltaproteobacteria bacterium]